MKKLNDITVIALSVAAIVFGILFCLNNIIGSALDIIFGICFILLGLAMTLLLSLKDKQAILTPYGIGGGAIIAFGITMIVYKLLANWFIYWFVPFIFIVLGAFLIGEAFLMFFLRREKKTTVFVVELVLGVVLLTLGILAVAIPEVQFNAFNIIEGVILIAAGLFVLVSKFVLKKEEE